MPTAYSYIRFSSEQQTKGDSLRRQLELSAKYAQANNLTLDETLNLRDLGVSAFKGANAESGALREFLNAVRDGTVKAGSYLLVESLDRISRNEVMEALELFTSIINAGITIVTLADNNVYSKAGIKDNWTQLIISISIMARAHEESAMKSQRIKAAWNAKKKIADKTILTKRCPSWMYVNDDKTKFILKPDAVAIVKRIIKMTLDGHGASTIIKIFNSEGVKNPSGGDSWQNSYITKILHNTALYGEASFRNIDTIPNYYPAIIDEQTFNLIQSTRKARNTGGGGPGRQLQVTNLFSGLCKCGYCGSSMIVGGYTGKKKKHPFKYLVCSNAKRGIGCHFIQWGIKEIEQLVLTYLTELDVSSIINEAQPKNELAKLNERKSLIESEIVVINKKIDNLVSAIAEGHAPQAVVLAISRLETKRLGLSGDLQTMLETITAEESSMTNLLEHQKTLVQLISLLSQKSGIELFGIRTRLSTQVHRLLKELRVKPGGHIKNVGRDIDFKKYRYIELVFRSKDVVRVVSLNKSFDKE